MEPLAGAYERTDDLCLLVSWNASWRIVAAVELVPQVAKVEQATQVEGSANGMFR